MKRTGMPQRRKPLSPAAREANSSGLARTAILTTRTRLRPVSDKRRAENRQRRDMVTVLYPERPKCSVPWCPSLADDLHEPLLRSRGGSITSPENACPLCRPHHDQVTFAPESELQWAYDLKILVHSWDRDGAA